MARLPEQVEMVHYEPFLVLPVVEDSPQFGPATPAFKFSGCLRNRSWMVAVCCNDYLKAVSGSHVSHITRHP